MIEPSERLTTAFADRYPIARTLGTGGMATVYLARDVRHDRDVAIKVLNDELAESLGRQRFVREIKLAARLNHPHILPLYDSGESEGFLYFVMPVMQGQTLRDRLQQARGLPLDDAIRIATEVADALDYAHRHDVVHRDIKPENILLHEGHAVVADFGIGKALAASIGQRPERDSAKDLPVFTMTQIGVTVGTPAYMSPEQATGEELDGRSDLFALGCVLYEMLTGDVAFAGATAQATIARRFVYSPPAVNESRADVPAEIGDMVARLLEKAPADRYATGADVVSTLRTATTGSGPRAATPRPDRASAEKSIAVLPFTNMSADADNEFFSDGLTEELITDLSRIHALRVISRTSSMQHKRTTKTARELGRELGVRYVLTGSVRRAGNALRIAAQLIDAHRDAQLWADKYAGTMDDVFDVQERVSRAIVGALEVTLSPEENSRLSDRPIADARAFELFLQARQELRHYNVDRALPFLARAIAIEGEVPALRALRALSLIIRVRSGMAGSAQLLDEAEAEARALISLAPDRAYGHALLGFIGYERGTLREGVRSLKAAMELDPTDADVHFFLGISLVAAGQHEEAYRLSQRVLGVDPHSALAGMLAGVTTWFVGRPAEGLESQERSLDLEPESFIHRWTLAYHYLLIGRTADAARQAEWLHEHAPQLPYTAQMRALVAAIEGRPNDALALLATVDIRVLDGHHLFHLAESFAMAGDTTRGMELFEMAVDKSFYPYDFFAVYCPFLAPLRGTAEFDRVLAKAARRVAEFSA
jgi:serine/threonine protein kinase/tetratricopeptide (TPR) repeat protein